ncbi:hypothetical protein ALC57_14685, partial [Trachymyrmex cornetzi]
SRLSIMEVEQEKVANNDAKIITANEDTTRFLIQPPKNFLNNSQIEIIQDNTKNMKKENQNTTSPRGVSKEMQVFSQGSLTVSDIHIATYTLK